MMESFEQRMRALATFDGKHHQRSTRNIPANPAILIAREDDAALVEARQTVAILENKLKVERGYQEKLAALNTAKGDLINLFETHFDTLNLWHQYQDDFKAVRARIRSLENE
jgi:hypothetical protein